MNLYVIYKQITDSSGNVIEAELIECDLNEKNAQSFSKLYNLQVPSDLRHKISYNYIGTRIL